MGARNDHADVKRTEWLDRSPHRSGVTVMVAVPPLLR